MIATLCLPPCINNLGSADLGNPAKYGYARYFSPDRGGEVIMFGFCSLIQLLGTRPRETGYVIYSKVQYLK